jgi:enamine deaminase RidA (YjgF/YER057c/UK114 family)
MTVPGSPERLAACGVVLPPAPRPIATFLPFVVDGNRVYLAGQTNEVDGVPTLRGRAPSSHDVDAAHSAARICALNLLAALEIACNGDLTRIDQFLMVRGFVNSDKGFAAVPAVVNGASQVFIDVFGDAGRHARTAVGVANLPQDAAVEVDAIVRLRS